MRRIISSFDKTSSGGTPSAFDMAGAPLDIQFRLRRIIPISLTNWLAMFQFLCATDPACRRTEIDQRLDELEHEAGIEWLGRRQSQPA